MLLPKNATASNLLSLREARFFHPEQGIKQSITAVYKKNLVAVGWPKRMQLSSPYTRSHTAAIVGAALGDEGKGRLVDNKIEQLLKNKKIKHVYVVRYQGGNNAGHTIEKFGIKLALHVVPSSVLYEQAQGIIDRGVIVHPEDLVTEVHYVEEKVGSITKRLFLSPDAILCTDIERAEEILNRIKEGKAAGGTGRGISPSYAHYYEKTGLKIADLLNADWQDRLGLYYERKAKEFMAFAVKLADVEVPDFAKTVIEGKETKRTVGNKKVFLDRLAKARDWIIKQRLITNTYLLHQTIYHDTTAAVLFEGAQAAGLDAWLGTVPDVTASNTSVSGIREGTAFWQDRMIAEKIGVIKLTYTSSVGARQMPTHINLPKNLQDFPKNPTSDQLWAAYVRETAHEYGTTTGRPRDITHIDLPFLTYNAKMSGIDMLAGTHLDIAREDTPIRVCTHYTNKKGEAIVYQPGIQYQTGVIPHFIELPGWDGTACQKAKTANTLPQHALKYLAFLEDRTGYPIITATTGTLRENIINF